MFERFSVECWMYSHLLWFGITILKDWLQMLAPLCHAVRSKSQNQSCRAHTRVFPRFGFSLSFVIGQSVSALVSTHSVDYLTKNNVHLKPFSFSLMVLFPVFTENTFNQWKLDYNCGYVKPCFIFCPKKHARTSSVPTTQSVSLLTDNPLVSAPRKVIVSLKS